MGALDGIKVVEVGLHVQGPQAALTLADWGAEVVKVELPGFGDQARWLPIEPGETRSAYFIANNRGKRSVTLDLRHPEGQEVFARLVTRSDVLVTNFKPGTMEGWGLGYVELSARNPRLIYAASSTYGVEGSDAGREGADLSAQAAGGLISTTGRRGGEVTPVGAAVADHIGSQNLVAGVVAALFHRERTGQGQRVLTSLLGGQVWAQNSELTRWLLTGQAAGPADRGNPMIPGLYAIFPTADGWIAVVGVVGAARTTFYEAVGRPELAERFAQPLYWQDDKAALYPLLDEVFVTRTTDEWCEVLGKAGLRYAPVRDHGQVVADPGVWANGYIVHAEGAAGTTAVVAPPVDFSASPARADSTVPELGQHTEEVLLEVGYTWDEITALRDGGAL